MRYIPYEKMSKKEKKKVDTLRRNTWGSLNPVTRKPENSKVYNRQKARRIKPSEFVFCSNLFL